MKGISRLLNKKCKRFKHHIRNILHYEEGKLTFGASNS